MDKDLQSIQEARDRVEQAWNAAQAFSRFSQAQVDAVIAAISAAATAQAERLARLAVEETTYGKAADKLQKNLFAAQRVFAAIKDLKTVGIVREDSTGGIAEIATPVGVVAAILPCTNPTSTAIYKTLIALKAGNGIVISPHPAAIRCICETVQVLAQAAQQAGAPEGLIGCLSSATMAGTQELMRQRRVGVILATGGMGIVRAAYSSGKPAFGVGPGNVPAMIDRSARIEQAVADVLQGKSFDWGTICSSEQAIVAERDLRDKIIEELRRGDAYFASADEKRKLCRLLIHGETLTVNPKCVGQSPQRLAEMAGFRVPEATRALVVELEQVGRSEPLSAEKLSPVLALYFVADREAAMQRCAELLRFGGMGHTCVIHAQDAAVVREYGLRMPAYRVVVNSPSPQGSIGLTTNLFPAMTLGCGALGGNITSDNIGPQHLMNLKRIAWSVRSATLAAPAPAPAPAAASGAAAACGCAAPTGSVAAEIVDRFLAGRLGGASGAAAPALATTAPPAAPSAVIRPILAPAQTTAARPGFATGFIPPPPPKPQARAAAAAEFVCEDDVRAALRDGHSIPIGARTIITPAARDLALGTKVLQAIE